MRTDSRGYGWFVLFLLWFVYVLNFLDRQLLSILAKPIQDELGLSDSQLGMLGGLYFAVFYCFVSLPVSWLADRTSRVRILAAACALWSAATVACGLARSYPQLAVARMAVGIGEAGGAPPSYSILSDYFPAGERGRVLALFSLGVPVGQALGVAFGAILAAEYDWRRAFIVLGVVGIFAAAAVLGLVREPVRGATDRPSNVAARAPATGDAPVALRTTITMFFTRPELCITAFACGAAALVNYALLGFATLFLMREREMSLMQVASYYSVVLGVSMGLGGYASGWLVDRLRHRGMYVYAVVPAIALVAAVPLFVAFVNAPSWQLAVLLVSGPLFLNIFYLAPGVALVQNAVAPNQRTLSGALLLLVLNLVGLGIGPTYVGLLSDLFRETDPQHSLGRALLWLVPFYGIAIALYFWLARILGWRWRPITISR